MIKKFFSTYLILMLVPMVSMAQTGKIKGKVTDKKNGETMVGAIVFLEGTAYAANVDIDGNYLIENIKPGNYNMVTSYVTYTKNTLKVTITADKTTVINIELVPETNDLSEVTVADKATKNTENTVLSLQKKSVSLQDGISSQEIKRTGSNNAAESAKLITGTSVIDGKYVYVRGLGDRYTIAQLNGAGLIGTDPYINSVPLDLIPSNLLDNIITVKTATPDQPGNFSGGIVNLATKDFPDKKTIQFTYSMSYNPQASFNNNFLSYDGGKYDWLGYDDGKRALPEILKDQENSQKLKSPTFYLSARNNAQDAELLDNASKSLNPQMQGVASRNFTNYNAAFSYGDQYKLFHRPLGVIFGLNHSRNYSSYSDGINKAWDITGAQAEELYSYYDLKDNQSVENPILSAMGGLFYKLSKNHEVGILNIYNHDAEKLSRYQIGKIPGIVSGSDKQFETRTLSFRERGLNAFQLKGKHKFPAFKNSELTWVSALTKSFQNEPDLRFFANENIGDSLFYISVSEYDLPNHFFRYLEDKNFEFKADYLIPLHKTKSNALKFGFRVNNKNRTFNEYRFYIKSKDGERYLGDQYSYFGSENTGIIGTDPKNGRNIIGNYVIDNTKISNNYSGYENVEAGYAMGIYEFTKKLKAVGGARLEHTGMHVESEDTAQKVGDINQFNLLPSVNLIYAQNKKTNLRVSFSQTMARPTMRELAPFVTFDFIGGFLYLGNPELRTTKIQNYDIRWEHFIKPGEVVAFSAYYKHFKDPIVKAYNTEAINPEIVFQNTNNAQVYGLEFDLRKNLEFIHRALKNFKVNLNCSYILSRVALDTTEYNLLAEINPEIDPYRPFQGQSPFLFNGMLTYSLDKQDLEMTLSYNYFGKRLYANGLRGVPDIYDQARGLLNFSATKQLKKHLNLRFQINNILNANYRTFQTYKGNQYLNESKRLGTTYGIGLTFLIK